MKQRLFSHLRGRFRPLAWIGVLALVVAVQKPTPAAKSREGLASLLETASGQIVDADHFAWEPSSGTTLDLLCGRGLFFLARDKGGALRDVFHAFVRVSPSGRPLEVNRVHNVTETPLGDDTGLSSFADRVAFATVAFDRVQAVSLLDTRGSAEENLPEGMFDRGLLKINSLQETGSLRGFGRTDILFDNQPKLIDLKLDASELTIAFEEEKRSIRLDLASRSLSSESGKPYARAVDQKHRHKPFVLWAVDTVRYEVGPEPILWLENKVFGARDAVLRLGHSLFSSPEAPKLDSVEAEPSTVSKPEGDRVWPPPPITSIWSSPKSDEGQWKPVLLPWLASLPVVSGEEKPPPYFYRTVIRPDPQRPYAELSLIAFDMRQLELRMQAGYEDPKPLTGPPGEGYIARDPEVLRRVVATFNGAFKTTHGAYGMMVDRRVLVPPVSKAASVVIDDAGDTGFGTWPTAREIPAHVQSFRQNLDPLVEGGVANPTGRSKWGTELATGSVLTERTAICLTRTHQIYYAWGRELSGITLSRALEQAGCEYAVHLDMNPKHCGLAFTNVRDVEEQEISYELADPEMDINPLRYVLWSPKDFFYLLVRDPRPTLKTSEGWLPSAGDQPEPSWLPGIFVTKVRFGGIEVELMSIERDRVDWRLGAGRREPGANKSGVQRSLLPADFERALLALTLGHAPGPRHLGLFVAGKAVIPLKKPYATLVVPESGTPKLYKNGSEPSLGDGEEAVQLPLLARDRTLTTEARELGVSALRGALCVLPNGSVLVARALHDSSDAITEVLVERGCDLVVGLDRGSHHSVAADRRGTATPPAALYDTTALFALDRSMQPRAYLWNAEPQVP